MKALGRHILIELTGCEAARLDDVGVIEDAMRTAASEAGATIVQSTFHQFSPIGVSGVVVIQESHLAIHTWPEYGYAAVDLFTCGEQLEPWKAFEWLKSVFQAKHHSCLELHRGPIETLARTNYTRPESRSGEVRERRDFLKSEVSP